MTSQNKSRDMLKQLLASLVAGNSELHQLDPSKPLDEQIDKIHAQQRADHIANCPDCQSKLHEENMAELKAKVTAQQEKLNPEASHEANGAKMYGDIGAMPPDRVLAGYMAFQDSDEGLKPIHESFDADLDTVTKARDEFMKSPIITLIRALRGDTPKIVVLPVFAD